MNERLCSRGYFGVGAYFAEDAGKVDQYIDVDHSFKKHGPLAPLHQQLYSSGSRRHPGRVYYILLCRVCLGLAACTRNGEETLDGHNVWTANRKSEKRELANIPGTSPPFRYHSELV